MIVSLAGADVLAQLPAIIFFISVVQVLFYMGFIQWFIRKFATFVYWALAVSGAEAVVAAATPFIGQGESAMLVRPFLPNMTKAELHQIMTCGFATISGSVLVGYIGLGLNAQVLISSCIMSIPASLAISKLRYPETEESLTAGRVVISEGEHEEDKHENALHAFAMGAMLGLRIAGSILTSLLCIIALVALINALLTWWGRYLDINGPLLTLQTIFGYLLYPVAFLLGVSREGNDIILVSKLIAEKIITVSAESISQLISLLSRSLDSDSGLISAERVQRLQRPGHFSRIRRPHRPIPNNCNLRLQRVRQHRLARYPDRHPDPIRAQARRRYRPAGHISTHLGRVCDVDVGEHCGVGHYYPVE